MTEINIYPKQQVREILGKMTGSPSGIISENTLWRYKKTAGITGRHPTFTEDELNDLKKVARYLMKGCSHQFIKTEIFGGKTNG